MTTPILLIFPVQFVMGLLIGLFMESRQKVVGANEFGVATLIFVLVNAGGIYADKSRQAQDPETLFILLIGWAVMWAGLAAGNILRLELIKRVVKICINNDIQMSLTSFLRAAQNYGYNGGEDNYKMMNHRLAELQQGFAEAHQRVCQHVKYNNVKDMQSKLATLSELCHDYAEMSEYVAESGNKQMIAKWVEFSDELVDRLGDTLRATENIMFANLDRLSTIQIVRIM